MTPWAREYAKAAAAAPGCSVFFHASFHFPLYGGAL